MCEELMKEGVWFGRGLLFKIQFLVVFCFVLCFDSVSFIAAFLLFWADAVALGCDMHGWRVPYLMPMTSSTVLAAPSPSEY